MASPPRIPLHLLASEDADLSPSLSLRPRDEGLLPGREAIEASLGALGAQAALALSFFGDITMPTVEVSAPGGRASPRALGTGDDLDPPGPDDEPPTRTAGRPVASVAQHWGDDDSAEVPGWTVPDAADSAGSRPQTALSRSYVPKEEIGRGGMGVVYRARQTVLHRDIAVKAARFSTSESRAIKFISEALITASLEHPNIVPVHDLTTTPDQRLALAMKLVGGTTWRARLAADWACDTVDLEYHLDVLMSVANAVAFAHSKYIIHCDIKPSNVLLGEFGEVLLVDWGIAFDIHEQKRPDCPAPHHSDLHTPCGTPQYIPPELARGAGDELGPWTDIFLLGAVLYEVLVGKAPHRGASAAEVLWQAVGWQGPDFSPDDSGREVPEALANICVRAMARAPTDRYHSVAEFQDDIRAFLDHRQSLVISDRAQATLSACRAHDEAVEVGDRHGRNRVYSEYADAVAGFREARVLWPANPEAIAGEREARLAFGRSAMDHNDLGLAEAQLEMLDSEDSEVANVLAKVHSAQEERQRSRVQARRLWTALVAAAVVLIAGLAVGYVLIDSERDLAERRLADIRRLADAQHVVDLQGKYTILWPSIPENADAMAAWLSDARELLARLPDHEAYLASLRAQGQKLNTPVATSESSAAASARPSPTGYQFTDPTVQWEHDTLTRLVADIRELGTALVPGMEKRLEFARSVYQLSIGDHEDEWARARAAIAAAPHYRGLELAPQIGLVPIGADPQSKLWEFAHIQTGAIPARGPDGAIVRTEDMAIVLVLVPGGSFSMGAQRPDRDQPVGSANIDPRARKEEGPVHEVALEPFFLSKYELTQGQWQRFTERNPSAYPPGQETGGKVHTALHPVEMVRWQESFTAMSQLGLTLPTEAQWEYATRAGTTTIYPTGDDPLSLRGALNIADKHCQDNGGPGSWRYETWLDDGHVVHAPVGSYRANAFGLHDTVGNVWEWCLDRYGSYEASVRAGDGERMAHGDAPHVFRGGGFRANVVHARSADRYSLYAPAYRGYDVGVRPARRISGATR